MRKVLFLSALHLFMLAVAGQSSADPVTLVAASRAILVSTVAGDTNTGTSTTFNQDVMRDTSSAVDTRTGDSATASAALTSFVSAETGMFGGQGATAATLNSTTFDAGGSGHTSYSVALDLTAGQRFDFAATFNVAGGNSSNRSIWAAWLFYFPSGPIAQTVFAFRGVSSEVLLASDILGPGRYEFSVAGVSDSFNRGIGATALDYTFALTFSDPAPPAVPEPASLLLLGSGLAVLAARRRLRART